MAVGNLGIVDMIVLIVFFAGVIGVGLWSSCRNRGSVGGYFLAGRSMHWIPVGASLFASNIGSGHFIGLAGSGAASGIGIAIFEITAVPILVLLGWVFLPVYISSGVYTMPEYLKKRFGGQRIRIYLSSLTLIMYILTKISADLYAGAVFIEQSLNFDLYVAVIILLGIAALFTILGGLTAVIWTDFVQTIIMVIGAFWLMIAGFAKVGSFQTMVDLYQARQPKSVLVSNLTCGLAASTSMNLLKPIDDPQLPWLGVIVGLGFIAIWYWCSDQVIVQRALAAKNYTHAKAGTLLAGYLKLLPMWLLVFPGMISRVLFPDTVGCTDPQLCQAACGKPSGCSDMAYPTLVLQLLGDGPRGLMMAVMISSLVSSLTSVFNSASTIFTIDIWKRLRTRAADTELMIVGRVFVLGMVIVSVAWIPIVKSGGELFHYIQAMQSYLSPPVCAVYLSAMLWRRCNEKGAFWGLIVGFIAGMSRFIAEYSYPKYPCQESHLSTLPQVISRLHYLHFGILLFFISLTTIVAISLFTDPIPGVHLHRLTFWDRHSTEKREDLTDEEEAASCSCIAGLHVQAPNRQVNAEARIPGELNHGYCDSSTSSLRPASDRLEVKNIDLEAQSKWYIRAAKWICGIEDSGMADQLQPSDLLLMRRQEEESASLDEDPKWKRIVNINAIVVLSVCLFMLGFFA